jgi:hypothetical protein
VKTFKVFGDPAEMKDIVVWPHIFSFTLMLYRVALPANHR